MSQYFSNDESIKSEIKEFVIRLKEETYTFKTDNGVFSKGGIDFGTKLLLESIPLSEIKGDILDVGCGYGIIGIYLKKKCEVNVDMIDVNERAIHLTKMNAKLNLVTVNPFISNCYENVTKKYDHIITNPPIRAGKKIVYEILFSSKKHLKENGQVWFVIRKEQGAESLIRDLKKECEVSIINKEKRFFIISLNFIDK